MKHYRHWIVSAYFIFSTLVGALWLEYYGLNISPDSLKYLDAAMSWNRLLELNGVWPPGYPCLIWILSSFGLSNVMAASVLSSLAVSISLYSLYDLGESSLNSWIYGVLSATILLLYTDIHTIILTVLTEGVFCGLLILFCTKLWHWLHRPNHYSLYAMTIIVGLSCLIRYAGYVLIPVLFYAVWVRRHKVPWSHWALVVGLSFSPLVCWLMRNLNRYEHLHGSRNPAVIGWSENLTRLWDTTSVNLLAGGLLLPFAFCSLMTIGKLKIGSDTDKTSWTWTYILWGIIGLQIFLTLYSSSTVLLDPINTRLTSGIYCILIPLSIIGSIQITRWIPKVHSFTAISLLLVSIGVAQSLADPNRESKERHQNFTRKYREYSFINLFGFNQSNTALDIRMYFEDILSASTRPIHVAWFEQSRLNQNFQLLHHRSFLFENRLDLISVTSNEDQIQFALKADGQQRSLIVHNLTRLKNKKRLQERIQSTMAQIKQSQMVLVGRKPLLSKWGALNMDWTVGSTEYQCKIEKNASLYAIVECNENTVLQTDVPSTVQSNIISSEDTYNSQQTTLNKGLYISEVMQAPLKVAKFRGEWIELYNPTDTVIDLSTYSIHSKNDSGVSFTKKYIIPAKSTFLMAVRKSPTGNGGLPSIDYLYNNDVLKIEANDWIEVRNGEKVVDRWELSRKDQKKGYSLQRNPDGTICHATQPYGDGDLGSPKWISPCQ